MRLGLYPCELVNDTWSSKAYGQDVVQERHRHRWEFNNTFRKEFEGVGLWPSGLSPNGKLIEIMEFADHPFMVGTQFHPEFLSRPNRPHPLFREFIGVAKNIVREGGQHHLPLVGADSAGN
jgi:CTP synthase